MIGTKRIGLAILVFMAPAKGLTTASATTPGVPFLEDFESLPDGSVDGLNGWSVTAGEAVVTTGYAHLGEKALRTGESCEVALVVESSDNVLWVEMWVVTAGGPLVPAIPPLPKKSAVLIFDCFEGIQALDGDGIGGGTIVNSGVMLDASKWYRLTIKLDFDLKTWDLYVDGERKLTDLGFHSGDVTRLSGMVRTSCAQSYMDTLSFAAAGPIDDRDQDGLTDLDEIQIYGTDPLSPDTDADGMTDGDEVIAGTNPTDPQSFFYLAIAAHDGTSTIQLSAPLVEGKTYQLQATEDLGIPDSWRPVADFVGDGLTWTWMIADLDGSRRFYRLAVFPQ